MTADDVAGWDSISHIRLIFAIEDEFGIKLSMKDLEGLDDVGSLSRTIARHTRRRRRLSAAACRRQPNLPEI